MEHGYSTTSPAFVPSHGKVLGNIDLFLSQRYCDDYGQKSVSIHQQLNHLDQDDDPREVLNTFIGYFPSKTGKWCLDAYDGLTGDHPDCLRCQRAAASLFIQLYSIYGVFFRRPIILKMDVDPKITQSTGHISPDITFSLSYKGGRIRFGLTLEHILNKDKLIEVYGNDDHYCVQIGYLGQYIYNLLREKESF